MESPLSPMCSGKAAWRKQTMGTFGYPERRGGALCGGTGMSKGTEVEPRGLRALELRGAQDHRQGGVRKEA